MRRWQSIDAGYVPGVIIRPRVVSVVSLGHVRTATEEESGGIVVGRGEGKHRNRARRRWAWEEGAFRGLDRDPEELANSQGPLSRTLGNSLVERFAWTRRFPDGMRYV